MKLKIVKLDDAQITDPNDELYDLQSKYDVKISRSNSSNAVYIFRKPSKKARIGHYINPNSEHLKNFFINFIRKKVDYHTVEECIKKIINEL